MNSTAQPPLLPLRIPAGWLVRYNELRQIDPEHLNPTDPMWTYMNQDLMQVESTDEESLLIDVGWYPDNDPQGHFGVKCVIETDWEHPVAAFQARTLRDLIVRLESLFSRPPVLPVSRLIDRLTGGTGGTSDRKCAAADALADRGAVEAIDAISEAMKVEHIESAYDRLSAARRRLIQQRVREQGTERGDDNT